MVRVVVRRLGPFLNAAARRPSSSSSSSSWLRVAPEVAAAVADGSPVVALETAILTHGLPRPLGLDTAHGLEAVVRAEGAVPATVAVLHGRLCVGLSPGELSDLSQHPAPAKVARRDLARLLGCPEACGGTTVSGTMIGAAAAGVPLFATGGIGGVHRGASRSWDVSSDLAELGRTAVCVVCAGAKSLLDLRRTLEVLETHGVCVAVLGADRFPAFFARDSGLPAPGRVDSAAAAARMVDAMRRSSIGSGLLLAVPVPEDAEVDVEAAVASANREAAEQGVSGRAVTPFVLRRVAEITDGASLRANVALVRNNAAVAARVAVEYSRRVRRRRVEAAAPGTAAQVTAEAEDSGPSRNGAEREVVVIGGSNLDILCQATHVESLDALHAPGAVACASHPGLVSQACGGVGRNVAEAVARLGAAHHLLTALGDDPAAEALRRSCPGLNLTRARTDPGAATAQYVALLSAGGELLFGLGDMRRHEAIDAQYLQHHAALLRRAAVVCVDANLPLDGLRAALRLSAEAGAPVCFEPTDPLKAGKLLDAVPDPAAPLPFTTPNALEFERLFLGLAGRPFPLAARLDACDGAGDLRLLLRELMGACEAVEGRARSLLVKLGPHGAFLWRAEAPLGRRGLWCASGAAEEGRTVVSVSGGGDSLLGAFLVGRWVRGWGAERSLVAGMKAAAASLATRHAVSPELRPADYTAEAVERWGRDVPREWL